MQRTCKMIDRFLVAFPIVVALTFAGAGAALTQPGTPVPSMTGIDIGTPEHVSDPRPIALSDSGEVLVVAGGEGGPVTLLYREGAFLSLGGEGATATGEAINAGGAVAGWSELERGTTAVLIGEDNLVEMPGEYVASRAFAINSEGTLAGEAGLEPEPALAVPVWWTESSMERLPSAGSGEAGAVLDLNTIEQMVGWSALDAEGTVRHATLWENGEAIDLGSLGGRLSEARAINETGLAVGASTTIEDQNAFDSPGSSAFSWEDGRITALGLGERHAWGVANDVNDVGMIVGAVGLAEPDAAGNETHAVLWTGQEVLDLNEIAALDAGVVLTEGISVNALGQILCRAVDAEGADRIVVLSVLGN
jgi:uncharacterized membrane protein